MAGRGLKMKILLTGGSGLVGRNIKESLENNFVILSPSIDELDLCHYDQVFDYISKEQPDLVIHCAGLVGGIAANIKDPVRFLVENIDMGRNVILAAYRAGIIRLINMGSSCMYPHEAPNPLKEGYILSGELEPTNEGYALAKIVTQRLCSYIRSENSQFNYKTLVPCNLYGKYDKFDPENSHMVPAIIKKVHDAVINKNDNVEIWGDGISRREFMYVDDLVNFVRFSIDNYDSIPEIINIGLGHDYSVNDYYEIVAKVIGYNGNFIHDLSKPTGMKQKMVDVSLASSIGWQAKVSLEDGIRNTYEYYKTLL